MTSGPRRGAGPPRGGPRRGRPRYYARRKVCGFCVNHVTYIDYKDTATLKRYLSDQFKIESRRKTGTCSKHQRGLAGAVKRARHLAMLPYSRTHRLPGGDRFEQSSRRPPPPPPPPPAAPAPDETAADSAPSAEAPDAKAAPAEAQAAEAPPTEASAPETPPAEATSAEAPSDEALAPEADSAEASEAEAAPAAAETKGE